MTNIPSGPGISGQDKLTMRFAPGVKVFEKLAAPESLHVALSLASVASGWVNLLRLVLARVARTAALWARLQPSRDFGA